MRISLKFMAVTGVVAASAVIATPTLAADLAPPAAPDAPKLAVTAP